MATFKIAVLGGSMIANWGNDCPELFNELKRLYSRSEFMMENHGVVGSRAGHGLWRITNKQLHDGHALNALSYLNPDVTVVESFAYENRIDGPEGMSEYRDILRRIVDEIRYTTASQVLFCIGVPPHRERFMENSLLYLNTSRATRQRFADDVKLYLDEARRIAQDEEWPLADVQAEVEKRVMAGENMRRFIDQSDNLMPSRYGYDVMSSVIVRTMDNHRMINEPITH
jgi:hypothetical protein